MGKVFTKSQVQEDLSPQIFDAVKTGKLDRLRDLICRKPELLETRQDGKSLLHLAVLHSQLSCLQYLLQKKMDPNIKDNKGITPLMELATTCKTNSTTTKMIGLLLKYKADINTTNLYKRSVLLLSLIHFRYHVSDYLLDHGADPNMADVDGLRPIHICSTYMALPLLQKLVQKKADINAQDEKQRTALYFAVLAGHQGIIDELLNHSADVNIGSLYGYPIQTAIMKYRYSAILALLDHGACVSIPLGIGKQVLLPAYSKAKDCLNIALILLNSNLKIIHAHEQANEKPPVEHLNRLKTAIKILHIIVVAYGDEVVLWKNPFFKLGQPHCSLSYIFSDKELDNPVSDTMIKEMKTLCRKLLFIHRLCDRGRKGLLPGEKLIKPADIPDNRSLQSLCRLKVRKSIRKTNVIYAVKQLDCTFVVKEMLLLNDIV